jgi:hypothetical protein
VDTGEPPRRFTWWHRVIFPDTVNASLSWGTERWRPAQEFPEYDALMEARTRLSFPIDPPYELTQHLLEEVVAAAAAIEYSVEKLEEATTSAQSVIDSWDPAWASPEPEHGSYVGIDSLWSAYAEFNNLLTWIRALEERIARKDPVFGNRPVGLLPSLAPGPLQTRVTTLVADLKHDLLNDARPLTNYVLHASVLPQPMSSTARVRDGRLFLAIPDRASSATRIRTRFDLSFNDNRTADGFAREALETVARFIDDLLDAFEDNTPERLRKSSDPSRENVTRYSPE